MNTSLITRRNMLQASAAAIVTAGIPAIAGGAVLSELATAQAWVGGLTGPGINIERSRITSLTFENVPLYQSTPFCTWLKGQGPGFVRNFFGWSPSNDVIGLGRNPVRSDLQPYYEMIERLTTAGIPVRFDFMDVTQPSDYTDRGSVVPAWLVTCASYAASYGFTKPNMICFGAFNEPADDGNNGKTWNPALIAAFNILRKYLPASKWTLSMQHNYWNDPFHLNEAVLAPDRNAIYDCHYYPFNQPTANGAAAVKNEWAGVASAMTTWSIASGKLPLLLCEAGVWNPSDQPYGGAGRPRQSDWALGIGDMTFAAGKYRPAPWAMTDGNNADAPPINNDSGASTAVWSSDITTAYQSASAFVKKHRYYYTL